jgi:uncharacterized membrane protein YphA (DoxX/SURF4 family)
MMAAMFVTGGVDALRNPGGRRDLVAKAGLDNADQLVRINAATMVVGGLGLATGRLPRLSALALAGTMVPTTVVGHAFWSESDKAARKNQQVQFFKNVSMLGGLLMAVADTGGRESIPHAASRITRRTTRRAKKAAEKAKKSAPIG